MIEAMVLSINENGKYYSTLKEGFTLPRLVIENVSASVPRSNSVSDSSESPRSILCMFTLRGQRLRYNIIIRRTVGGRMMMIDDTIMIFSNPENKWWN